MVLQVQKRKWFATPLRHSKRRRLSGLRLIYLGLSDSDLTECLGRLVNTVGCPEFAVCFQCIQFAFGHSFKNVVVRGHTMENENVIGKVCFAILRKGFVASLRISLELDSPGCIVGCKFDGAGIVGNPVIDDSDILLYITSHGV